MEACAGAHRWARQLMQRGYPVKIIPPQYVKPFIKSNKNDANDAQALHRIRDEIKSHRIAKANQIRGLVTEYGLVAPQQLHALPELSPIGWKTL